MTSSDRNVDDDSYDEVEEQLRERDPDEEDRAYFPPEESKPPHYWSDMKAHALFLLLFLVLAAPAIAQPTIIKGPALLAPSNSANLQARVC